MSLIQEYNETQRVIKELEDKLALMKPNLEQTLELVDYIKAECAEKGIVLSEFAMELCPELTMGRSKAFTGFKPERKKRLVKVYKNPHTGEVVETKGGNHKVLKEWKSEFGGDVVESWLEQ